MQIFFPKTSIKYSSAIGGDGHGHQLIKNLTVAKRWSKSYVAELTRAAEGLDLFTMAESDMQCGCDVPCG